MANVFMISCDLGLGPLWVIAKMKYKDGARPGTSDFAKVEIFYRTFGLVKCNISQDRIKICRTEKFKWNK